MQTSFVTIGVRVWTNCSGPLEMLPQSLRYNSSKTKRWLKTSQSELSAQAWDIFYPTIRMEKRILFFSMLWTEPVYFYPIDQGASAVSPPSSIK